MGRSKDDYFDDEADCFRHSDNINGAMCNVPCEQRLNFHANVNSTTLL